MKGRLRRKVKGRVRKGTVSKRREAIGWKEKERQGRVKEIVRKERGRLGTGKKNRVCKIRRGLQRNVKDRKGCRGKGMLGKEWEEERERKGRERLEREGKKWV